MRDILLALAAVGLAPGAGAAQENQQEATTRAQALVQRAEDLGRIFNGPLVYDDVFAASFVAAIPEASIHAIAAQLTGQLGPYHGVHAIVAGKTNAGLAKVDFRFGNMLATGIMQIEPQAPFRVTGFRLSGVTPLLEEGETIAKTIAALPGQTNVLFTRLDGSGPIMAHNPETPLAISSACKLWVLSALVRAIDEGVLAWDDVHVPDLRRVPTGGMHEWPAQSPVTLHTLATVMIALSDNTATDALIGVLGRKRVEAELRLTGHANAARNLPFLTTRELMVLKWREQLGEIDYAALDLAEKRAALEQYADVEFDDATFAKVFGNGPTHLNIEWFASPRDLAAIMRHLGRNAEAQEILAAGANLPAAGSQGWRYVGYKGGAEPGVVNFTWLLRDGAEQPYVLTMSWNDPDAPIDRAKFNMLAQALLARHAQAQYFAELDS